MKKKKIWIATADVCSIHTEYYACVQMNKRNSATSDIVRIDWRCRKSKKSASRDISTVKTLAAIIAAATNSTIEWRDGSL